MAMWRLTRDTKIVDESNKVDYKQTFYTFNGITIGYFSQVRLSPQNTLGNYQRVYVVLLRILGRAAKGQNCKMRPPALEGSRRSRKQRSMGVLNLGVCLELCRPLLEGGFFNPS